MSKAKIKISFQEQIIAILEQEGRPMSAHEVADVLGMNVNRLTGPMSKLNAYGRIMMVQRFRTIVQPTLYMAKKGDDNQT